MSRTYATPSGIVTETGFRTYATSSGILTESSSQKLNAGSIHENLLSAGSIFAYDLAPTGVSPVEFDGTNDYLTKTALIGQKNTKKLSIYCKCVVPISGSTTYLLFTNTEACMVRHENSGAILWRWYDDTGTVTHAVTSSTTYSDETIEICCGLNTDGSGVMYINGVLEGTDAAQSGNNMQMTPADWNIGAVSGGTNKFDGIIHRITLWDDVALDVTDAAIRSRMANEADSRLLGNNIIDFYGLAAVWNAGTNHGSGGDFTMNGAVVDYVAPTLEREQDSFRFYNDDGTEATATALENQNVNLSINKSTPFHARFAMQAIGNFPAESGKLQVRLKGSGEAWDDIL
jgi:hypothetical protein